MEMLWKAEKVLNALRLLLLQEDATAQIRQFLSHPQITQAFRLVLERGGSQATYEQGEQYVQQWVFRQRYQSPVHFPAERFWNLLQGVLRRSHFDDGYGSGENLGGSQQALPSDGLAFGESASGHHDNIAYFDKHARSREFTTPPGMRPSTGKRPRLSSGTGQFQRIPSNDLRRNSPNQQTGQYPRIAPPTGQFQRIPSQTGQHSRIPGQTGHFQRLPSQTGQRTRTQETYRTGQHPRIPGQTGQHPRVQETYHTGQHPRIPNQTGQHPRVPAYQTGQHPKVSNRTGQHPRVLGQTGQHPRVPGQTGQFQRIPSQTGHHARVQETYRTGQHPRISGHTGQHPRVLGQTGQHSHVPGQTGQFQRIAPPPPSGQFAQVPRRGPQSPRMPGQTGQFQRIPSQPSRVQETYRTGQYPRLPGHTGQHPRVPGQTGQFQRIAPPHQTGNHPRIGSSRTGQFSSHVQADYPTQREQRPNDSHVFDEGMHPIGSASYSAVALEQLQDDQGLNWNSEEVLREFRFRLIQEESTERLRAFINHPEYGNRFLQILKEAARIRDLKYANGHIQRWVQRQARKLSPPLPAERFWNLLRPVLRAELQKQQDLKLDRSKRALQQATQAVHTAKQTQSLREIRKETAMIATQSLKTIRGVKEAQQRLAKAAKAVEEARQTGTMPIIKSGPEARQAQNGQSLRQANEVAKHQPPAPSRRRAHVDIEETTRAQQDHEFKAVPVKKTVAPDQKASQLRKDTAPPSEAPRPKAKKPLPVSSNLSDIKQRTPIPTMAPSSRPKPSPLQPEQTQHNNDSAPKSNPLGFAFRPTQGPAEMLATQKFTPPPQPAASTQQEHGPAPQTVQADIAPAAPIDITSDIMDDISDDIVDDINEGIASDIMDDIVDDEIDDMEIAAPVMLPVSSISMPQLSEVAQSIQPAPLQPVQAQQAPLQPAATVAPPQAAPPGPSIRVSAPAGLSIQEALGSSESDDRFEIQGTHDIAVSFNSQEALEQVLREGEGRRRGGLHGAPFDPSPTVELDVEDPVLVDSQDVLDAVFDTRNGLQGFIQRNIYLLIITLACVAIALSSYLAITASSKTFQPEGVSQQVYPYQKWAPVARVYRSDKVLSLVLQPSWKSFSTLSKIEDAILDRRAMFKRQKLQYIRLFSNTGEMIYEFNLNLDL